MRAGQRRQKKTTMSRQPADSTGFLRWLLGLSLLALLFEIFPELAGTVWSTVDVRGWTWKSYAVISSLVIAVLTVAKSRQDSGSIR